jgi:ATP-binding cassette subfamily B protein
VSTLADQLAFLWEHLRPQARALAVLVLTVAAGAAASLGGPVLLARYIDAAESGRDVALAAVLFLLTACSLPLLGVAESWIATLVAWRSTNRLRSILFRHSLEQDLDLLERHPPGTLISRIDGDVELLSEFLSTFLARLGTGILVIAGVLAVLARVDWRLSALLAAFLVLCAVALNAPGRPAQRRWLENRRATGQEFGALEELLSGIEDIRANGASRWAIDTYWRRAQGSYRTYRSAQVWSSAGWGGALVLYGWATAASLALATWLHDRHALTLGGVYLVFSYADAIQVPLNAVNRQLQLLQSVGAALTRMRELMAERSRLTWPVEPRPLPPGPPSLELDRVDFSYPGGREALRGVSFRVEGGRRLGVVGRTGSGKTTIARLLLRFQDPAGGRVSIQGTDLRDLPRAELRSLVAYVPQDVQLLHGTVRDNLTLYARDVSDDRLLGVLRALELDEWLQSLPAGLDTLLAAGARDLSAGQAQLLAAARAFLADPGLVVLDEASSKIDLVTETRLEAALDRLLAGRTACIIAHRLATLRNVDDVLVMESGRVAEFGPRAELEQEPGSRYAALLRHGLPEALA